MSRQLEGEHEARQARRAMELARACDEGLIDAVDRAGGDLLGFSAKITAGDCLLTIRATFPAGGMVAFVGAETLGGCILKAVREAKADGLRWKPDKYARQ